jgi:hypothetical protein
VAELPPVWPGALLVLVALLVWMGGRRGVQPVLSLGLLGALTLALLQFAASRSIDPLYNIKPMAEAIRHVQEQGLPVANGATYHAQYQFLGRLEKPLDQVRDGEIEPWLAAHPDGYIVLYLDEVSDIASVSARYKQRYSGGAVVLVDTRTAVELLAAAAD